MGEGRVQLGHVDRRGGPGPRGPRPTPSRSRAPSEPDSIRCQNDVIQAGRSHSSRARAPDARMTTAAPSPTGAQSCARSGSAT